MTLNDETSRVLKYGTLLGLCIMTLGLLTISFDFSEKLLAAGVLILILTPPAGIVVSTKCLIQEGDRTWTRVALTLIAVLVLGIVISYML